MLVAGGLIEAYKAQCSYFKTPTGINFDVIRLIEQQVTDCSLDIDLTDCPQVEKPESMLPLIGALRHNSYFRSLSLTECHGNQKIVLMVANVVRFNTHLTKIKLWNMQSPLSFQVFGDSLAANRDHSIQVLDLSNNKLPSKSMENLTAGLASFSHALRVSLSLLWCVCVCFT